MHFILLVYKYEYIMNKNSSFIDAFHIVWYFSRLWHHQESNVLVFLFRCGLKLCLNIALRQHGESTSLIITSPFDILHFSPLHSKSRRKLLLFLILCYSKYKPESASMFDLYLAATVSGTICLKPKCGIKQIDDHAIIK